MKLLLGDCIERMKELPANSVDTIITDVPYGLSFMGKKWDYDVPSIEVFENMLRVSKPGATLLCFAGTRTQHRIACNVEDAGWVLKDCIMWLYGSGFPKATDISKQLDKGYERKVVKERKVPDMTGDNYGQGKRAYKDKVIQDTIPTTPEAKLWNGWKSHGLKPAYEPILVAMKPNEGSYAANALKWKVAGLNIEESRINYQSKDDWDNTFRPSKNVDKNCWLKDKNRLARRDVIKPQGRFPSNVILECICDEVREGEVKGSYLNHTVKGDNTNFGFRGKKPTHNTGYADKNGKEKSVIHTNPACPCYILDRQSGSLQSGKPSGRRKSTKGYHGNICVGSELTGFGDKGGASRFFYCAKASKSERNAGCEGLETKQVYRMGHGNNEPDPKTQSFITQMKNHHPTVKPIKLMQYLCTLTRTPTGGTVLDPFLGSGTTGIACVNTDRDFIGIEKEPEYMEIAKRRIDHAVQKKKERLF